MKQTNYKPTTAPLTLKQRLAALKQIPAFFALVWQCSPQMVLASVALRLFKAALPFCILYVGKIIIDQIILLTQHHGHADAALWQLIGLEFGLALLSDLLGRLITLVDSLLGENFANHTSVMLMEHAATLDLEQFEDAVFYDKMERARQQTVGRTLLLNQLFSQLQDLITAGFLISGLLVFNGWLILLLMVAIIPAFWGESHFNNLNYALSRRQTPQRRELDYLRYLGASDETAKEVKLFGLTSYIIHRFKILSGQFYQENRAIALKRSGWGTVFALIGSLGYYGAYVIIISRTINGFATIGELTFLVGAFRQLRGAMENILMRFATVSQGAVYLKDFFEFFEIMPRIHQPAKPRPFPNPIRQGFTFENVSFRYQNSERWANHRLNFTLHPGEKLALVGENGAGKTTLVKLLTRLYDPTEGRILLDGHDLREYDVLELRRNTGAIFQDFLRYQMTFSQNIAAGNITQQTNHELITQSAQLSLADEVAMRLPKGYEQMLGKRFAQGVELSGGEWQKVAIARAYARQAQLLILDEPTSALDARSEHDVFQRFIQLTRGKTAVLISHRFSTVRMADRILMLENGEVAEAGTHTELLALNGRYAQLFNLQARGYQ